MFQQRIAVIGGGSLGLFVAGHLSLAGHRVSVAQRRHTPVPDGIRAEGDEHWQASAVCYVTLETLEGPFDQVIVAVKSHDLPEILPQLGKLGDARTQYLFLQNGVPWWWSYPAGQISGAPSIGQIVAVVVYHASERIALGQLRVRRVPGDRYLLARTDGGTDAVLEALVGLWQAAGIPAQYASDIRAEVWSKLMGNATFNPMSAITGAGMSDMVLNPLIREVLLAGMAEVGQIAAAEGVTVKADPQTRIRRAEEVGNTRTSMLQDRLAGRRLELDALLGQPVVLARRHGIPVPVLKTLWASLSLV